MKRIITLLVLTLIVSIQSQEYRIFHEQYRGLFITDEVLIAPLPFQHVHTLHSFEQDSDGYIIRYSEISRFNWDSVQVVLLTNEYLEARMENVRGLKAHFAQNYPTAIEHFTNAAELDPELIKARTNLACAQTQSGDFNSAIETLQPLLDTATIATLLKIHNDSDLRPLLETLEIQSYFAQTNGSVRYDLSSDFKTYGDETTILTYSENLNTYAVIEQETNDFQSSWEGRVTFFDSTLTEVYREIVIENDETSYDDDGGNVLDPEIVQERLSHIAEYLSLLGFTQSEEKHQGISMFTSNNGYAGYPVQQYLFGNPEYNYDPQGYSAFWKTNGTWIHMFQNGYSSEQDTLLAGDYFQSNITYYKDFNIVVFYWMNDIACGGPDFRDHNGVTLISVTAGRD